MNTRLLSRLAVFALAVLVLASVLTAAAAANFVPVTRADDLSLGARTAEQLKPTGCPDNILKAIFICTMNNCKPTGTDVLVLGNNSTNRIDGKDVVGVACCVGAPTTTIVNCTWP
jgi:hypothetical protein